MRSFNINSLLPPEVRDRSVWYATDNTDWIEEISADQIGEVETAVEEVERSGVEIEKIIAAEVGHDLIVTRHDDIVVAINC